MKVPTLLEMSSRGEKPEVVFWIGCAGSFDDRSKKITKAFVKILNNSNISFAVLGAEESCSGDPAKRSGNEFLFQIQALQNINSLNKYNVTDIVTTCPHCFNTLKNEYPELGGKYNVFHHSQFLKRLLLSGKLKVEGEKFKGKKITYHDPCYLGRANNEYKAPRELIEKLKANLLEMKNSKSNGLCCGAGGAQMFKEPEKGDKDINIKRSEEAIESKSEIIAVGCPFCNIMMSDGIKSKEEDISVLDIAQMIERSENL